MAGGSSVASPRGTPANPPNMVVTDSHTPRRSQMMKRNRYEGDVDEETGVRQGVGTLWFVKGHVYTGEFKDGKQHGKGTYVFASGAKYEGEQWL